MEITFDNRVSTGYIFAYLTVDGGKTLLSFYKETQTGVTGLEMYQGPNHLTTAKRNYSRNYGNNPPLKYVTAYNRLKDALTKFENELVK